MNDKIIMDLRDMRGEGLVLIEDGGTKQPVILIYFDSGAVSTSLDVVECIKILLAYFKEVKSYDELV